MKPKNNMDLETYRLVKEAMASEKSKEEFRQFLEKKKEEADKKKQ
ncbi:anti-repressor SinI family protein [Ammoniphilus sp. CFH 90114]|nr:anti-repressor SinI family protein [Ammoniphilus sp. CFH 90114]